jgi:hypothetical protein
MDLQKPSNDYMKISLCANKKQFDVVIVVAILCEEWN